MQHQFKVGEKIEAQWNDKSWYGATVVQLTSPITVKWDDGGATSTLVSATQMRCKRGSGAGSVSTSAKHTDGVTQRVDVAPIGGLVSSSTISSASAYPYSSIPVQAINSNGNVNNNVAVLEVDVQREPNGNGIDCTEASAFFASFTTWFGNWWSRNGPVRTADNDPDEYFVSGWFIAWSVVILSILIPCVASSYHYVNYNEYGLKRNNYGSIYLHPTLEPGRYFYSLSYGVVYFPSTYQSVDFKSSVFADNGMEFDLHVRFYYKMPKDKVGDIYNRYSKNYHTRVENNGKNVIKNVGTMFKVDDYVSNRSYIENIIALNISVDLESMVGVEVPQTFVKIVDINFPKGLISQSLASALALQTNELQLLQQEVALVQAQTNQLVSSIDAQATLLLSNTNNKCSQIVGTANEISRKMLYSARSDNLARMFDRLGVNETAEKEILIQTMAIFDSQASNTTFMYGVTAGAFVNV